MYLWNKYSQIGENQEVLITDVEESLEETDYCQVLDIEMQNQQDIWIKMDLKDVLLTIWV